MSENIAARLDRLERRNRHLRIWGLAGALLLAATVVMGQARPSKGPTVLEAQSVRIVGEDGKVCAELAKLKSGDVGLTLRDTKGTGRLWLGIMSDGSAALGISDQSGKVRMSLGLQEAGTPRLVFLDDQGETEYRLPESRAKRQGARRVGKGEVYAGVGGGHWVKEKIDGGKMILLEDGSLWEISPGGRLNTMLWLPITNITVLENDGPWPYKLVNTDDGETAEAKFLTSG